jgi:hypothetical protein
LEKLGAMNDDQSVADDRRPRSWSCGPPAPRPAGGVDLDDFAYRTLHDPRGVDVRARLRMLEHALPDFVPGPYEQLAAAYRQGGDEELSEKVLLARQRRRHAEAGPAGRVWGARAAARDGGVRLPPLDGFWRLEGASQWISSGLVTAGWILATTAAAGAARILERV